MSIKDLILRRAKFCTKPALAHASLRYEALRSLSLNHLGQIVALNSTITATHADEDHRNDAFDRLVDKVVLSNANEKAKP